MMDRPTLVEMSRRLRGPATITPHLKAHRARGSDGNACEYGNVEAIIGRLPAKRISA